MRDEADKGHAGWSPSELNVPTAASKRSASVFLIGQNWRFCALFGGLCQAAYASQSRTESSPGACALFAALEAKHRHPQLVQRCISAACAAFRACHQLWLLLLLHFYCGLHELSNKQQEVDTAAAEN
jgi:hypothetical protein